MTRSRSLACLAPRSSPPGRSPRERARRGGRPLAVVVLAALLGAAGCPIDVEVGEEDDPPFGVRVVALEPGPSLCSEGTELAPAACDHAFGEVAVGQSASLVVRVDNAGAGPVEIAEVRLEGSPAFVVAKTEPGTDDGQWSLAGPDDDGVPGALDLTVAFLPALPGPAEATLHITYRRPGGDEAREVLIALHGEGTGAPPVQVLPASCDFGVIGEGQAASCTLTLANVSDADVALTGFVLEQDGDTFRAAGPVAVPVVLPRGATSSLVLTAEAASAGTHEGTVRILTDAPGAFELTASLRVVVVGGPIAVARTRSVNDEPITADELVVRPLDDVVLTGEDSSSSAPDGSIVAWQWDIVEAPAESSVTLTTPDSMMTGFSFQSADGPVAGLDVAGTFVVRLSVTDDRGLMSVNDARVTLNATPQATLLVQLTWDSPMGDLDLHLRQEEAAWCSEGSCYAQNCVLGSVDWDGVPGASPGDPVQDIDDLDGFGPENIFIEQPVDGVYRIGVHAFSAVSSAVTATVKVFAGGALLSEDSFVVTALGDFWDVADITVIGGESVVGPVAELTSGWSCP